MPFIRSAALLLLCLAVISAFSTPRAFSRHSATVVYSERVKEAAKEYPDEPQMNPDRPELPELKGDFDWDEKFGDDDDWITENVPGKVVVNEIELAAQVTALGKLEEKWRKKRLQKEYEEARILGWTGQAETYNGRFAMFFLVVGLLTELWTGIGKTWTRFLCCVCATRVHHLSHRLFPHVDNDDGF
jgi:hypothetical protein